MTDLEALDAYRQHADMDAFVHLVRTYQSLVHTACLRMLDNATDAEDAAQETFVRLVKHAGRIDRNVAAWLHATARTVANDRRRSERSRRLREAAWSELQRGDSGEVEGLLPAVDECMAQLPEDHRELVLQHYVQGRTQTDLASANGISQPAIKKRLDKAIGLLRERLRESGVAVSAAVLAGSLAESTASAAVSARLTASLCELGAAGLGRSAGGQAPAAFLTSKAGIGLGAALVIAVVTAVVFLRARDQRAPAAGARVPQKAATVIASPNQNESKGGLSMDRVERKTDARFRTSSVRQEGGNVYLDPIPRFPRRIRWVDGQGTTVRHEMDGAVEYCRIMGNLYCAMRMQGHDVDWAELVCASGGAFRFTFEARWAQDAEFVSHVDHFVAACETLGFEYAWLQEGDRAETLKRIDASLRAGHPALVSGWETRHWRVVVGLEPEAKRYRCIGGLVWDDGAEPLRVDVPVGGEAPDFLTPAECPSAPVPSADWYGAVLGPDQAARNPVFLVGGRREIPAARERILRTLRLAREMNRPMEIARKNLAYRVKARAFCLEHDGWKFYYSPWEGTFVTGAEGLRVWASQIETMARPSHDFEMIHGINTAMGNQIRRAASVVAWLDWAQQEVGAEVAAHLRVAQGAFVELAGVVDEDLGLCCLSFVDDGTQARTYEEVSAVLDAQPALCYLLSKEQKEALGERAGSARPSPWGWCLLPSPDVFAQAKVATSSRLRHLADLRDHAFLALAEAEKAMAGAETP